MSNIRLASFTNTPISNGGLSSSLPKRIKVLNWGKNETLDNPVYLNEHSAKIFMKNQKEIGRDKDIPLDFDHCTVPGSKEYVAGAVKHIAAYGNPLLIPGDGLYLDNLQYTPLGEKDAKNYCDLSPAPMLNENNEVIGLHSVALTPTGAIGGLRFYSAPMTMKQLKALTGDSKDEKKGLEFMTTDEEALKKTKELEKHEEDEIKGKNADCMSTDEGNSDNDEEDKDEEDNPCYTGMEDKMMEHRDAVHDLDAEDHESKYGDVKYADQKNHRYPIDTEKHVRAAWSYINMPKNAAKVQDISAVKGKIKSAAKKYGIEISDDDGGTKTKAMSAEVPMPDAYKNAEPSQSTITRKRMLETLKEIAPEKLGVKTDAEILEILKSLVAEWAGVDSEDGLEGPITNKENSKIEEFSARLGNLEKKYQETMQAAESLEKQEIVKQASADGKIIPLSADSIKVLSVNVLKEMVAGLPKNKVPSKITTRVLNTDGKNTELKGLARAAAAIDAVVSQ